MKTIIKTRFHLFFLALALPPLSTLNSQLSTASAQGTAFTYQCQLLSNGNAENGVVFLNYALYTASAGGSLVAGPIVPNGGAAVAVSNGLFTVILDFGSNPNPFNGQTLWLETDLSTTDIAGSFARIGPRVQMTPTPYAIMATYATALSSNAATSVDKPNLIVQRDASGNFSAGTITAAGFQSDANGDFVAGQGSTVNGGYSTVGGGVGNTANGNVATVGGGEANRAIGDHPTVAGGYENTAKGTQATVGGGFQNQATNSYATVPGGAQNVAGGQYSLAAGQQAQATNQGAFVWADSQPDSFSSTNNDSFNVRAQGGVRFVTSGAGLTVDGQPLLTNNQGGVTLGGTFGGTFTGNGAGLTNLNFGSSSGAALGAGSGNSIAPTGATDSFIGGGVDNTIQSGGNGAVIGGGYNNTNSGVVATVGGGQDNTAGGAFSTVVGGQLNSASAEGFVGGGYRNTSVQYAAVGGGAGNTAGGQGAFVGGGGTDGKSFPGNSALAASSTIGGGLNNTITSGGNYAFIGGGASNTITSGGYDAFIGGGASNTIVGTSDHSVLAGGRRNIITNGNDCVIGGGLYNTAGNQGATVSGGEDNAAVGQGATVGGGASNDAGNSGVSFATVGGGNENSATDQFATVGGGQQNTASGANAVVPGGWGNEAEGYASFAAGVYARAANDYTFVWSDGSSGPGWFSSTAANQFLILASGGVGINTASPQQALSVAGSMNVDGNVGIGTSSPTVLLQLSSGASPAFNLFQIDSFWSGTTNTVFMVDGYGNVHTEDQVYANGVQLTSDRNAKENFKPVDYRAVLTKVASLPVTQWNYKTDSQSVQHVGPVAQDFQAAFGLNGTDDKHISMVDESGVALAAIQGLNQKLDEKLVEKDAEIEKLKAKADKVDSLEKQLNELKQLVQSLAAQK